jgi:hypothetical protein
MYAACDREAKTHEHDTAETGTGEEHANSESLFPVEPFYHRGSVIRSALACRAAEAAGLACSPHK